MQMEADELTARLIQNAESREQDEMEEEEYGLESRENTGEINASNEGVPASGEDDRGGHLGNENVDRGIHDHEAQACGRLEGCRFDKFGQPMASANLPSTLPRWKLRPSVVKFSNEENAFLIEAHRQDPMDSWAKIADDYNERFAGHLVVNSEEPCPFRTAAALRTQCGRIDQIDEMLEKERRVKEKEEKAAGAAKREARAEKAKSPGNTKKQGHTGLEKEEKEQEKTPENSKRKKKNDNDSEDDMSPNKRTEHSRDMDDDPVS
ncbi:MAG: hypothetical protein M1827_001114 [Pycnora praestabilis]|nr:MAG: hypothetical protein M1827_001114 [Pycnora praestabilis]